jgi:hypothetical protein
MEPRNAESKKVLEQHKEGPKGRFQIVKLEERIAPRVGPCRGGCAHYAPGHNK